MCEVHSTMPHISEQGLSEQIEYLREALTRFFHDNPDPALQRIVKIETDPRHVDDEAQHAALARWICELEVTLP